MHMQVCNHRAQIELGRHGRGEIQWVFTCSVLSHLDYINIYHSGYQSLQWVVSSTVTIHGHVGAEDSVGFHHNKNPLNFPNFVVINVN